MHGYEPQVIEEKWQQLWEERQTFRVPGPGDPEFDASKPKFYVLDMFPYPSGKGLHVGHPIGYIGTDIVARYKRMSGHNVLHPMGYDSFGLPADQYAVETGIHPRITTDRNIDTYERQLRRFGFSYDWSRGFATTDPDYYRWTQWIFLQLFGSWFDGEQARPVAELVAKLESGELDAGGRAWADLDEAERRALVDRKRLAYLEEVEVNWCPMLGTVLANEEVTNEGKSDRGDFPVYRRPLRQWMLRITAYADRLIDDLELIEWPESVKTMQRNWIGRSHGADVAFPLADGSGDIVVYTTRPDTLFGATYMVLAPEHPLVDLVTTAEHRAAVEAYRERAIDQSEVERMAETRAKTGEFTGGYAVNPVNGEEIPVWVADYVLMGYGTGAIMAVPAGDQRDFEFAQQFGLPIRATVVPPDDWLAQMASGEPLDEARARYLAHPELFPEAYTGYAVAYDSANDEVSLDGLPSAEAIARIIEWLEETGKGEGQVRYKLRDWLFSRQRYWGEPIPILHGPDGELRPVDEDDLPLELPDVEDFRPHASEDPDAEPQPALVAAPEDWRVVEIDGKQYRRELNVMPQWAGSCWYYLRYIDPGNDERLVDPAKERYWMAPNGVDLYVGGVEHAVLHLLYARFWHKVLYDLGHVSTPEPFAQLFNQGYITAPAYVDTRGIYVEASEVDERGGKFLHPDAGEVTQLAGKMGKSLKNSVSPDDVFAEHGCDVLRMYEMYMGPLSDDKPWTTRDIIGIKRFLHRVWRNYVDQDTGELAVADEPADEELRRLLHRTVAAVTDDVEDMRFNTAIARMIELNNELVGRHRVPREVAEPLLLMLAPFAPHFAEELWERLGHETSVAYASWPDYDEKYLVEDSVELVVQIDGKVRSRVTAAAGADRTAAEAAARADDRIAALLDGVEVAKVIVVPDRLVNFVVAPPA